MGKRLAKISWASARIRVRSPSFRSKATFGSRKEDETTNYSGVGIANGKGNEAETKSGSGNKIMVVVDSSLETKGALEWALSHTVQAQDTLFLLHVIKPAKTDTSGKRNLKAYGLLLSMKNMCQARRPGVQVVLALQEGTEKGLIIVEAAKQQNVQLLVLGQRKQTVIWGLLKKWVWKRNCSGVVDYCIQNADCMTIAVRRKEKRIGGYLITTKRHKNFWLLA